MNTLVLEYKVVTLSYFLDNMQNYELFPILNNLHLSVKSDYEMARLIMYSNVAPWSKGGLKPKDVISFPWDDDGKKKLPPVKQENLTQKDVDRMFANANKLQIRVAKII